LVERLVRVIDEAGLFEPPYLVGKRSEYADLGLSFVRDARSDSGPLAGIVGLLAQAQQQGAAGAIVVACDLPYVTHSLVRRLIEEPDATPIVCPRVDDRFQPLFGRYRVDVLPSFGQALDEGRLSLQPLLRAHGAYVPLLDENELAQLRDWDTPEDAGEGAQ
jgi:molybdopterin-guanine dinucleotide biosynthesis protein A